MSITTCETLAEQYPAGIDYYDPTHTACDSAATAFLMWRIGAPEALWYPDAIDMISGRGPGQATSPQMSYANLLALLEEGAEMLEITPFDSSRMYSEGLGYLEEFYQNDPWFIEEPEDFYTCWSDSLEPYIEATDSFERRVRSDFRNSFTQVQKMPKLDELRAVSDQGFNVKIVQTTGKGVAFGHMAVLNGIQMVKPKSMATMFNPELAHREKIEGPIVNWPLGEVYGQWIRTSGIIGVKKYSSKI
jgi:hypothetical protein